MLVEKPLAPTVTDCQRLCELSRRSAVIVMVGHIERFNPAVRKLRELIRAGKFGDITSIITRRVGLAPPRIRDADVVTDLAVHDIDIANFLIGKQPVDVYANSGNGNLKDRVDFSEIFLNYGSCNAIISVNWLTPLKIRKMSVTGTQGYAELDSYARSCCYSRLLPATVLTDLPISSSSMAMMTHGAFRSISPNLWPPNSSISSTASRGTRSLKSAAVRQLQSSASLKRLFSKILKKDEHDLLLARHQSTTHQDVSLDAPAPDSERSLYLHRYRPAWSAMRENTRHPEHPVTRPFSRQTGNTYRKHRKLDNMGNRCCLSRHHQTQGHFPPKRHCPDSW